MADFCTTCCKEMFPETTKPDIDIEALFNDLEDGESHSPFLCEGCTIIAVGKFNGKRKAMYLYEKEWVDYSPEAGKRRFNEILQGKEQDEEEPN